MHDAPPDPGYSPGREASRLRPILSQIDCTADLLSNTERQIPLCIQLLTYLHQHAMQRLLKHTALSSSLQQILRQCTLMALARLHSADRCAQSAAMTQELPCLSVGRLLQSSAAMPLRSCSVISKCLHPLRFLTAASPKFLAPSHFLAPYSASAQLPVYRSQCCVRGFTCKRRAYRAA
ncbi:hypothetical protein CALCODRAFT_148497 [Calocera cornea HHB12733]|uniref:Uncharacterized protein n=1 Tax=Calocera cornea HHB12733 TaxID=1353952 RepID=A0A165CPT1_9BASI|nr:hypothetical protein CALCODRAFT_148497 [Calocera cornea HHB12733]